jgi:hypothetical protein
VLQRELIHHLRDAWLAVVIGYSFGDPYINAALEARMLGHLAPKDAPPGIEGKTIVVDPKAWWRAGNDFETIDGTATDARIARRRAMYVNGTARAFAASYAALVQRLWVGHVRGETWEDLSVAERFRAA